MGCQNLDSVACTTENQKCTALSSSNVAEQPASHLLFSRVFFLWRKGPGVPMTPYGVIIPASEGMEQGAVH